MGRPAVFFHAILITNETHAARAPYALSVSVGVATARRGESLKDALDVADRRLYEAKKKS